MAQLASFIREPAKVSATLFLALAVLLGGASHPDILAHHILQLLTLGLLAAAIFVPGMRSISLFQFTPILLALLFAGWSLMQIVPLPVSLSPILPEREVINKGASLLGAQPSGFSISFTPEKTLLAMLGCLPPLAAFVFIIRMGWSRTIQRLQWGIPTIGCISVIIGLAQVFSGPESPLYFYSYTSNQLPVGVFSNVNHQATLCLISLVFVFALAGKTRKAFQGGDRDFAKAISVIVLGLANLIGVLAAGSVAGYAILVPVLILSFFLMLDGGDKRNNGSFAGLGLGGVFAVFAFSALTVGFSPMLDGLGVTSLEKTELSRLGIWDRSNEILSNHIGTGSGLGSFRNLYPLYEDAALVTAKYVNHAHNDYLQIAIETGIPGLILLISALLLWLIQTSRIWAMKPSSEARLKRAAAIGVMVVILHSMVDYPLRTPAIATLTAICLAIMMTPQRAAPQKKRSKKNAAEKNEKRISI